MGVGSYSDERAASSAGDAVNYQAVIALRTYAGQVGGDGVDGHHPTRPRGIPDKEDGQAGEHAPVGDFGAARFEEELCEVGAVSSAELLLAKASEPRRTIWEQGLPFANGEPIPIEPPVMLTAAWSGQPAIARKEFRWKAQSGGGDEDVNHGPAEAKSSWRFSLSRQPTETI